MDAGRRRSVDGARGGGAVVRALRQPRGAVPAHATHVTHHPPRRPLRRGLQRGERHGVRVGAGAARMRGVRRSKPPRARAHAPRRRRQRHRGRAPPRDPREEGRRRRREEEERREKRRTRDARGRSLRSMRLPALPRRADRVVRVRGDDKRRVIFRLCVLDLRQPLPARHRVQGVVPRAVRYGSGKESDGGVVTSRVRIRPRT
mmetsp:Transcript_15149/g.59249  ORF Transcript_15149/g.59249 Transcript_15149/m.59249 type:complete len:203 (-) Transcript_15149:5-613(-)